PPGSRPRHVGGRPAPQPGALPDEVVEDSPHGPTYLAAQGRAPPPARNTFVIRLLIDAVAQNTGLELVAQELRGTLLRAEVIPGNPAHGFPFLVRVEHDLGVLFHRHAQHSPPSFC